MKRIEGLPWSRLFADPQPMRRFMHRDIKPANVMIGAFGEVYLLDWGLAVAVGGQAARHAPAARDVVHVAGTPGSKKTDRRVSLIRIDRKKGSLLLALPTRD